MLIKRKSGNYTIFKARNRMIPETGSKSEKKTFINREKGKKEKRKSFPIEKRKGKEIKGKFAIEKGEMVNQEKRIFPVKR